jgi:hypothetical protein
VLSRIQWWQLRAAARPLTAAQHHAVEERTPLATTPVSSIRSYLTRPAIAGPAPASHVRNELLETPRAQLGELVTEETIAARQRGQITILIVNGQPAQLGSVSSALRSGVRRDAAAPRVARALPKSCDSAAKHTTRSWLNSWLLAHYQRVHAGVDLRISAVRLRHAE